jgi:membrane fusion protein (multidrug efflux system)
MKLIRKYSIAGAVAAVIVAFVAYRIFTDAESAESRRQNVPLVEVEKPLRETVKIQLEFNGDVMPVRQAAIFSKVSGNLERIYADMGYNVRANQLLATIDSTELYQQFQQANATYQNVLITYNRLLQLLEKNLSSKQDVDNADAARKVAKAGLDAAATRLSYARIVAPFHGIITRRYLDPGALVTASNSTLFNLMNLDSIKVIVNVPEKDVPSVYRIRSAEITLDALPEKKFHGRITRYSDAVDLTTRTMAIQIDVANSTREIKPGMFATVQMTMAEHPSAVTIPTSALLKDDSSQYVFVADGEKARRLRVKTGAEQNARTEILSGLTGEKPVITVGQQFVRDGGPINIQR